MTSLLHALFLSLLLLTLPAHAAQIEVEINGQKQIVEFNPNDKADLQRAWDIWNKGDDRKSIIYFTTCIIKIYQEPREDAKFTEARRCDLQLHSNDQSTPELANLTWDKNIWYRSNYYLPGKGWIRLDDPNIVRPEQLKPMKDWPIRYVAEYEFVDDDSYDNYSRMQFDREGFLLNSQTLERAKFGSDVAPFHTDDKALTFEVRMFYYGDYVRLTTVSVAAPDVAFLKAGGMVRPSFNLKQLLATPKVQYDDTSGEPKIHVWASFDDPVKPVYDKAHGHACVMDCKDKSRWVP